MSNTINQTEDKMKYSVEEYKDGQMITSTNDCTVSQARSIATRTARNETIQVYVTWYRKADGQHGYLNPDGNHAITGKAW